ncbi:MAG: dephospho-CoA kinase [Cytophagales bacterium]|nr:MAG: dephospho-CoA kinase [Cytophagales bacterium]
MLKVGITGGIGAGKSTVAKVFQLLGIPLYNADERAKLLVYNPIIRTQIVDLLGSKSYSQEGVYENKWIASRVFQKPELLSKLNSIIHPAIAQDFSQWQSEQTSAYVLKEAALLVEAGSFRELDYLIVVTAPEQLKINRVQARDGRTLEQIKAIIAKQCSDEEKILHADFLITNDEQQMVIPQVIKIHRLLLQHLQSIK